MPKEVSTTVAQQLVNPAPAFPVTPETAGGIGFTIASVIGAVLYLRQRTSRVSLGVQQDRTEGKMLQSALDRAAAAEADAREAWAKANADAGTIGQLRAENDYLKRELAAAQGQITLIRQGVQDVGRNVDKVQGALKKTGDNLDSGVVPLADQ